MKIINVNIRRRGAGPQVYIEVKTEDGTFSVAGEHISVFVDERIMPLNFDGDAGPLSIEART
jgi:hypothetical protein